MTDVCVVGSVNLDLSLAVDAAAARRDGAGVVVAAGPRRQGGNQAVAAARAGARVQFVGAVGDDVAAGQLRAHLQANGVGLDGAVEIPGPAAPRSWSSTPTPRTPSWSPRAPMGGSR